jgi:hypothetical protein
VEKREEFEDTKRVIRIRTSKKNRQHKEKVQKDKQLSTRGLCSQRINTNIMFKKINEIIDANMDTVTNNSFLFMINSNTHKKCRRPLF